MHYWYMDQFASEVIDAREVFENVFNTPYLNQLIFHVYSMYMYIPCHTYRCISCSVKKM